MRSQTGFGRGMPRVAPVNESVLLSERKARRVKSKNGFTGSMSAQGCHYVGFCAESFFASLQKELIYRDNYATIEKVKSDIFS